jgi:hypothetical protein
MPKSALRPFSHLAVVFGFGLVYGVYAFSKPEKAGKKRGLPLT